MSTDAARPAGPAGNAPAPSPLPAKPPSAPASREDSEDIDVSESTGGSALEEEAARGPRPPGAAR